MFKRGSAYDSTPNQLGKRNGAAMRYDERAVARSRDDYGYHAMWREEEREAYEYQLGRVKRKSWSRVLVLPVGLWVIVGLGVVVYLLARTETESTQMPKVAAEPSSRIAEYDLQSAVWSVAFSPDGSHLAGATIAGDMWLANRTSGQSLRVRIGEQGSVRSVAFSPDGKTLAVAGADSTVRVWDVTAGVERGVIDFEAAHARFVAFSSDGKILAVGGRQGQLALWDMPGARWKARLEGHQGGINALGFSPDGSWLYSGDSSGLVKVWHVATACERIGFRAYSRGSGGVVALAVSPDGRLLATAGALEPEVVLWDAATGKSHGSVRTSGHEVTALAFSPVDPLLAMARGDGCASLWDYQAAQELAFVQASERRLESVMFSKDGQSFATGGIDGNARLWSVSECRSPARG